MTPALSVLDLAHITQGSDASRALGNSLDLARHAERWGYLRFWLAEHHNMAGIASAATAVVIGHVAAGTSTIRVGAGGIMLPNHAPLIIAEQFGTLAALHPGRIDLGLGRAPGTDPWTSRALRRGLGSDPRQFPADVEELLGYFGPADATREVRAVPGQGLDVPVWILGSSLFGAELAARMGLPFAFASHFAPQQMTQASDLYRERFRPSAHLERAQLMLALNVIAAETDVEAQRLFTSLQQAFVLLRQGRPGPLPPPVERIEDVVEEWLLEGMNDMLACRVVGSEDTVRRGLGAFADKTGADELIVASAIFDHSARLRSYEITAQARS
ncbi:MAG: LLM class flavin-dependent oxidoreductase [Deltaproteobacteria bacterium]|nr:LLM class flavin-dependent oxidoreductase [Deltaproteobacteria bacterium]